MQVSFPHSSKKVIVHLNSYSRGLREEDFESLIGNAVSLLVFKLTTLVIILIVVYSHLNSISLIHSLWVTLKDITRHQNRSFWEQKVYKQISPQVPTLFVEEEGARTSLVQNFSPQETVILYRKFYCMSNQLDPPLPPSFIMKSRFWSLIHQLSTPTLFSKESSRYERHLDLFPSECKQHLLKPEYESVRFTPSTWTSEKEQRGHL